MYHTKIPPLFSLPISISFTMQLLWVRISHIPRRACIYGWYVVYTETNLSRKREVQFSPFLLLLMLPGNWSKRDYYGLNPKSEMHN